MLDSFSEMRPDDFTYSKKSHFDFFKDKGYDIELYGKNLNIDRNTDLIAYQNLMLYSFLNNKKDLKILQIGTENLISFEKLQNVHECWKTGIESISKSQNEFHFTPISINSQIKIENPKGYFDFIFLSTAINKLPNDVNIFKDLLSNIKYLLKTNGIFLSSFTYIIINDKIWVDEIFHFFVNDKKIINNKISYWDIKKDPDLFVLSEYFYNKYWEKNTNKSYEDFGKVCIYNLFLEKEEEINPNDVYKFNLDPFSEMRPDDFTYSKKSHFDFFKDKGYDIELYEKNLDMDIDTDLITYQNLMLYSFLNNKKNLKILQIGTENLISFEKLQSVHECWKTDIESISKSQNEFHFLPITKSDQVKIENPKGYFDFIFLSTRINKLPNDVNIFNDLLSNIKYLLKTDGIFLSSFTNIIMDDKIWADEIFHFFAKDKKIINNRISYWEINKDPDLFVLTENFYNENWKKFTNKPYKDFGKIFIYNLFLENKEKIHPKDFYEFNYLKKSHKKFFTSNNYTKDLFKNINGNYTLDDYRSLIVYSFVRSNFKKGDRILQIGNAPENLENLLKANYDFFKLDNANLLMENDNFDDKIIHISKNGSIQHSNYKNFFSFSYSISELGDDWDINKYLNFINNIDKITTASGLTLFSFKLKISENNLIYPNILPFLFDNNAFKLNKLIKNGNLLSDDHLYYSNKTSLKSNASENNNYEIKESVYNMVWKKLRLLPASCKTKHDNKLKEYPIYIFHHLMKCGGTSLFSILNKWFKTVDDNIFEEDLNSYVLKKYNTNIFHNDICLKAHFQRDGVFLHERYPELLSRRDECRAFIFIRNPLSIKVSKYYYLRSIKGIKGNIRLKDSLLRENNFTASLLPCDETNYKEIIDRYFFVGIVERLQESYDLFADLIGKKKEKIPFLNASEKDSQLNELTPEFLTKFRNQNELDYKIYDYCLEKFNKLLKQ